MRADATYELRLYDQTLLTFRFVNTRFGREIELLEHDDDAQHLMPLGLSLSGDGVYRWMEGRALPTNRRYARELCDQLGVALNDTEALYRASLGLSLNDSYWVVPEGFDGSFDEMNLFENGFSEVLAAVAYCGIGDADVRGRRTGLTPELTTSGNLPKAWRIVDGQRRLYKSSTKGFYPGEPLSEALVSDLAASMGLNSAEYWLDSWEGVRCSVCDNFATKDVSYVPFVVASGFDTFVGAAAFFASLGLESFETFADMAVLDALVCNTDRHYSNFGVLRDNETGGVLSIAPIFDNGRALFPNAAEASLQDFLREAELSSPVLGGTAGFIELAGRLMGDGQKEKLSRMRPLEVEKYPHEFASRIAAINEFVAQRRDALLELPCVDRGMLLESLRNAKPTRVDYLPGTLRAQDLSNLPKGKVCSKSASISDTFARMRSSAKSVEESRCEEPREYREAER